MEELSPAQPANPSDAYDKWCGSCKAHCCHDIAFEVAIDELPMISETTPIFAYPDDNFAEFGMSISIKGGKDNLEPGFHFFQRGRVLTGLLVRSCGNSMENGLCSREERGLPKPRACQYFSAGGDSCKKRREMHGVSNTFIPLGSIATSDSECVSDVQAS